MRRAMNVSQERGVALVLALLMVLLLSTLGAALVFLTNTEALAAMNYRVAVQSRYAAESGVQATINWLSNNASNPTLTNFNMAAYPVQCNSSSLCANNGGPVVLSGISGVSWNYPDATGTLQSSYQSALSGASLSGLSGTTYSTSATLLSMTTAGLAPWLGVGVIQTWQITSQGSVSGLRSGMVQVVATYQNTTKPIFVAGVVSTTSGCSVNGMAPIYFNGPCTTYASSKTGSGPCTDSYNSKLGPFTLGTNGAVGGPGGNSSTTGGNVTSNGLVSLNGAAIDGTIYTSSSTKVGTSCPTDGINTGTGGTYGGISSVPTVTAPCPWGCAACGSVACYPAGVTPVTTNQTLSTTNCNAAGTGSVAGCKSLGTTTIYDGGAKTTANQYNLAPGTYGNLTIDSADVVYLTGGQTYNINSIAFSADGQFVVSGSGAVTINITGAGTLPSYGGVSGNVPTAIYDAGNAGFNLCNNSLPGNVGTLQQADCDNAAAGSPGAGTPSANPISGIPAQMQIVYAGTGQMRVGGAPNALVIYMPNAPFYQPGAPVGLNGSIVSASFVDSSNSPFNYDNALQTTATQAGPFKLIGFSWSKY